MFHHYKGFCAALLLLALSTATAFGQSKLKRAKESMEALDYMNAIQLYQQILQSDDNAEAKINLAECYRKINDTENAEYWYSQVVRLPEAQPIHKLYYGMMLQVNGKCDLAKEWYDQFTKDVPEDVRGQYLVKACDYEDELMTKNAGIFEITHMAFNSNLDDYSPVVHKNQIIFASDRDKGVAIKRVNMWTGNAFAELWAVDFKPKGDTPSAFEYGRPEKYSKVLNTKYHEAAVAYSPDGKTIYFTRNNYLNGKTGKSDEGLIKLKIFYGAASGDESWANLQSLPFNSDEYSVAHPTVSPDGKKLYFASDMPGGFGGMDLYVSEQESNSWGPPINLGPAVNTEGSEIFPHIDRNNRLYFASDGHIGLGGLDIYYTTEKGLGEWNVPVNLGYPVNTNHDDFGMTYSQDGSWGFFTSDRDGGVGRDDVYSFKKIAAPVEILIVDAQTKEPISGATIENSLTGNKMTTGADGRISFDMKLNECADFTASKEGYEGAKKEGCTKKVAAGEAVRIEIPLEKMLNLDVQGIVFDMTDGLPAAGAKVSISNDCGKTSEEPIVTTEDGRFKFKLDKNCCYTIRAEKDGFIAVTADSNCTKNLAQNTSLNVNLNLQPYKTVAPEGSEPVASTEKSAYQDMVQGKFPGAKFDPDTQTWLDADGNPLNGKIDKNYSLKEGKVLLNGKPADGSELGLANANDPSSGNNKGKQSSKTGSGKDKKKSAKDGQEMPTYDKDKKLYVDKDGNPANVNMGNGLAVKDGILYDNGKKKMPREDDFAVTPDGDGFLLHIYYDFDAASIRSESESQLQKLLGMLNDNPDFIVEVASHTDSRGSDNYNYRLSQRRAEAVIAWLVEQGIGRDRLIAHGFGESEHVNNCVNKVPCSEKEHQLNRRTEFRILGCKGGSNITISKPKANPKVDPCQGCPF